jgi:uncharacterized protein YdaU (DUF1376 family)
MNYYEHHIGDYAEATAHLSFLEDAAYSRLIRKYYATEKPLPKDPKVVQRLILARSKDEKDAVQSVLNEFFILKPDGWHQDRCDREIARYKDKQAKARRSAEARWSNCRTKCDEDATECHDAMPPQCERITLQTPITKHQAPISIHQTTTGVLPMARNHQVLAEEFIKAGVMVSDADENFQQLQQLNPELIEIQEAISQALEQRKKKSSATPINPGYVLAILKANRKKPASEFDPWWVSHEGIDRKGHELQMRPQGNESYDSFKSRIFKVVREREEVKKYGEKQ